jgi:membrane dipeptidase
MQAIRTRLAAEKGLEWYDRSELRSLGPDKRAAFMNYYREIVAEADELVANDPEAPTGVTVADFVDHIDYMVNLIGIDHVGISSDFDGGGGVGGWQDASETFNVTLELVKRGYNEEDIQKLWGENLLRVLDEVQAVSAQWQS